MQTHTFNFWLGERTYTVRTEPSPAFVAMVGEHLADLLITEGETRQAYGERVYAFVTATPERFGDFMRMALAGDHTGVDWWNDANMLRCLEAVNDYLLAILPHAIKMLREAAARRKEKAEELAAVRDVIAGEARRQETTGETPEG